MEITHMAYSIIPTKLIAASTAILLLAGCAPQLYAPPQYTQAQLQQDNAQCDFEANKATASEQSNWMNYVIVKQSCLKARGYHE